MPSKNPLNRSLAPTYFYSCNFLHLFSLIIKYLPMSFKALQTTSKLYKYLTPREFISLLQTDRGSIKKSKFIAPKLGTFGMGKIYVEYNYEPRSKTRTIPKWQQKCKA